LLLHLCFVSIHDKNSYFYFSTWPRLRENHLDNIYLFVYQKRKKKNFFFYKIMSSLVLYFMFYHTIKEPIGFSTVNVHDHVHFHTLTRTINFHIRPFQEPTGFSIVDWYIYVIHSWNMLMILEMYLLCHKKPQFAHLAMWGVEKTWLVHLPIYFKDHIC
jgi:hypothetical protein